MIESVRPVEVPVITETRRLVARGEYRRAVQYGYSRVLADLRNAYQLLIEPSWTHSEILQAVRSLPTGPVPDFLRQLLELYGPARYGSGPITEQPGTLLSALLGIYSQRPMWYLYRDYVEKTAPSPETAKPARGNGVELDHRATAEPQ